MQGNNGQRHDVSLSMRALLGVIAVAGCWHSARSSEPIPSTPATDASPCAHLVERVRTRSKLPATAPIEVLACTQGAFAFAKPGWLVDYRVPSPDGRRRHTTILYDGGDSSLPLQRDHVHEMEALDESEEDLRTVTRWQVHDLDGDGHGEAIAIATRAPPEPERLLLVFRFDPLGRPAGMYYAGQILLEFPSSTGADCMLTVGFAPRPGARGVVMTTTRTGPSDENCQEQDVQSWTITKGSLAPVGAP